MTANFDRASEQRMIINISGPIGCGKTLLRDFPVKTLAQGPRDHWPVTIIDGGDNITNVDAGKATYFNSVEDWKAATRRYAK